MRETFTPALETASAIRAGRFDDIDWGVVAEELEDMGRSEQRAWNIGSRSCWRICSSGVFSPSTERRVGPGPSKSNATRRSVCCGKIPGCNRRWRGWFPNVRVRQAYGRARYRGRRAQLPTGLPLDDRGDPRRVFLARGQVAFDFTPPPVSTREISGCRFLTIPSKQKIPLGHRQHRGRLAGEQTAVGAYLVGLGIDLDLGLVVVVNHVPLTDPTGATDDADQPP